MEDVPTVSDWAMSKGEMNTKWYVGGLHFECAHCGNCCAGPDEGYIWITRREVDMLAGHLAMGVDQLREKYLTQYGKRCSIVERADNKDCIFLTTTGSGRGCAIYPVRPNQCRIWPFWSCNLSTKDAWDYAAAKCPGINRGRLYAFDEIEELRRQKKWWTP